MAYLCRGDTSFSLRIDVADTLPSTVDLNLIRKKTC